MTGPESDKGKRCTIVDLSYPPGQNVNQGMFKNNYYGRRSIYALDNVLMTRSLTVTYIGHIETSQDAHLTYP